MLRRIEYLPEFLPLHRAHLLQLSFQHGQAEAVSAHLVAEIGHVGLAIQFEHVRIADHLGIPAFFGDVDTRLGVVAHPVDQVGAGGIADAVAVLLAAIVAAVAIAEEHVVFAVGVEHVRAGLRLVFFDAALDQVPIQLVPVDAVVETSPCGSCRPARPCPSTIFHLRPAMYHRYQTSLKRRILGPLSTNGSSGRIAQHRPVAQLGEGLAPIAADRHADGNVERHRFAARPASVVGAHFVASRITETG